MGLWPPAPATSMMTLGLQRPIRTRSASHAASVSFSFLPAPPAAPSIHGFLFALVRRQPALPSRLLCMFMAWGAISHFPDSVVAHVKNLGFPSSCNNSVTAFLSSLSNLRNELVLLMRNLQGQRCAYLKAEGER